MADDVRDDDRSLLDKLIAVLLGLPWTTVLSSAYKLLQMYLVRLAAGVSGDLHRHRQSDAKRAHADFAAFDHFLY